VRPSAPTALSGTTYRVAQAGQVMIIVREAYPCRAPRNKSLSREQPPSAAFFHIDHRL
jgi:hypothetical protein